MTIFDRFAGYLFGTTNIDVPYYPPLEIEPKKEEVVEIDPTLDADVVIVGGGPVGWWDAVLIKLQCPTKKIVVLDKHATFQRGHVLRLDAGSFKNIPNDPRLKAIVAEFIRTKNIRTNDIESKLKTLAIELGVLFKHQEVVEPTQLKEQFKQAKFIIGADGSHSVVRHKVFANKLQVDQDLQYIAELKCEIVEDLTADMVKSAVKIASTYKTQKRMKCVATEHVGKAKNGIKPYTVRLFIDKQTYEKMKDKATFKKPLVLNRQRQADDSELVHNMRLWLNAKNHLNGQLVVEGSQKVTVTRLGVYASEQSIKFDEDGTCWALSGDALFGVPYFRSLNNGFLGGTVLAASLNKYFETREKPAVTVPKSRFFKTRVPTAEDHIQNYATQVQKLIVWEVRIAKIKNIFINIYHLFIVVSGWVPWQIAKWSAYRATQFARQEIRTIQVADLPLTAAAAATA